MEVAVVVLHSDSDAACHASQIRPSPPHPRLPEAAKAPPTRDNGSHVHPLSRG